MSHSMYRPIALGCVYCLLAGLMLTDSAQMATDPVARQELRALTR